MPLLGAARSFYSNLTKWRKRKEKAEAKGKKFTEHPSVPPRTWNKSATLYAGMWKERGGFIYHDQSLDGQHVELDSVFASLVERCQRASTCAVRNWYTEVGIGGILHTPVEKKIKNPVKIEKQIKTNKRHTHLFQSI